MGSKAVEERRLRLVYDALDLGNPKKALQEADKVLKKHPNTHTAKVLRALSLIRMERISDACVLLEELETNAAQYEDPTLQAFVHCFKELNQPERISALYEKAAAANPSDHLYTSLFMSHVRCCNYKEQQKTALALYRIHPTIPYYLWAVMSVVMQASENPDMGKKMLLPLAHKMLMKIYTDNGDKWANPAEVELVVIVLEKQGRFVEAADVLESPAAQLLSSTSAMLMIRIIQLRIAAKQWNEVLTGFEESLSKIECADQWLLWVHLFDATFGLVEECTEEAEKLRFVDRAFTIVQNGREIAPGYRGPRMAHFEFIARLEKIGLYDPSKYGDKVALLLSYVRQFYTRPSCFVDLIKWLHIASDRSDEVEAGIAKIVDDAMRAAIEQMKLEQNGDELERVDRPTTNVAECWAIVLQERVRRWYGKEMRADDVTRRARVLRIARGLLHTQSVQAPSGALAHLAAEGLYECYRNGDSRSLYELVLLLETAARNWNDDHVSKLALMNVYSLLGCPGRMRQLSELLDIKMVQRDSLGHLGFHAAELGGHIQFAAVHYTGLGEFYDLAEREISECLITAYKNGAFTQIEGVAKLRRKMRMSIMAMAADTSNRWISSAFSLKIIENVVAIMKGDSEPIDWESLSDNRDYTIFPPGDADVTEEIKEFAPHSKDEIIDISRTRHLIMRVAANIARGSAEVVGAHLKSLNEHIEHCLATYPEEQAKPPTLSCTPPSFLGEWLHTGTLHSPLRLLRGGLEMIEAHGDAEKERAAFPSGEEMEKMFGDLLASVKSSIDNPSKANTVLPVSTALRFASRALQSIAFCRQITRIIEFRLVGDLTAKQRLKKAESDGRCAALVALFDSIRLVTEKMGGLLDELKDKVEQRTEECFPATDEGFWNVEWAALMLSEKKEVDDIILRSYLSSIDELKQCLIA